MSKRLKIALLLFAGILPFELNGIYNPRLADHLSMYWGLELLIYLVLPVVIFCVGIKFKLFTSREIGFSFQSYNQFTPLINILLFLILVLVVPPLLHASHGFISELSLKVFPENFGEIGAKRYLPQDSFSKLLAVLYFSISGGVVEEFYYRGIIRKLFQKPGLINTLAYIIVSSLIFSSAHWEGGIQLMFIAFLYGCIASSVYLVVRNLWPLIIGHSIILIFWLLG